MRRYALIFALVLVPAVQCGPDTNKAVQCSPDTNKSVNPIKPDKPNKDEKRQLTHFPGVTVSQSDYTTFSDHIVTLLNTPPEKFLDFTPEVFRNVGEALKKRLESDKSRLLSDVFITTIHDLIGQGKMRELNLFKLLLITINQDEHIFWALQTLPEEQAIKLLRENQDVRNWWDASYGKDWLAAKDLVQLPALEFAPRYLEMHKRLRGQATSAITLHLVPALERNDVAAIDDIRQTLAQNLANEKNFRKSMYPSQQAVFFSRGARLHDSGKYENNSEPEWKQKIASEEALKAFIAKMSLLIYAPPKTDGSVTIEVNLPPQKKEGSTSGAPWVHALERQLHPVLTNLRLWAGVGIVSVVAALHSFYRLKEFERILQQEHLWVNWGGPRSLVELKNSSASQVVGELSQEILRRRHTRRIFESNEKILLDFLSEVENEKAMLTWYRARGGLIKRMRLEYLFGLDTTMMTKAEDGLLRLQVIEQKVLEYILDMKVESNVRSRKVVGLC